MAPLTTRLLPLLVLAALPQLGGAAVPVPQGNLEVQRRKDTCGPVLLAVGTSMRRTAASDAAPGLGPPPERASVSLLAASGAARKASAGRMQLQGKRANPSSWFGSFSDGESSFDAGGVDQRPGYPERGLEPVGSYPVDSEVLRYESDDQGQPAAWFEETPSGGQHEAWRTFFPALDDHGRGSRVDMPWVDGQQQYQYLSEQGLTNPRDTTAKEPAWFDASAAQFDSFGRGRMPSQESTDRFTDHEASGWTLLTSNATLKCASPGCIANATLQAFDFADSSKEHDHCRLTIGIHATDFDDEYSREHVEWISVNGHTLVAKCNPMASGCAQGAANRPLYPCVTDFQLHSSVLANGSLNIQGKLSPMVDECPFDGNLLSGVATVSCYVRARPAAPTAPATTEAEAHPNLNGSAVLRCKEPGCEASANVLLSLEAITNRTCRLTVKLFQTDFDDENTEELTFVKIDGNVSKEHLKPGQNPCKAAALAQAQGNATTGGSDPTGAKAAGSVDFVVIDAEDITDAARDGVVTVSMKLSDMVDECGSNGYLLDGLATVSCI